MMAAVQNNDDAIDEQFEEEIDAIKSMYPEQVSVNEQNVIKCIINDNLYILQTEFTKSMDGKIIVKVSNHPKSKQKHSKIYLNKIQSKLIEISSENCDSMPIFQCISYLNDNLNAETTENTNNDNDNNDNNNNNKESEEKKNNDNKANDNKSNNRFKSKHSDMHNRNDLDEYDYYYAYNYKHYVKDAWSTDSFVFFYKDVFSQWFPSKFIIDNITYCNCEQYMMAEKAKLFNDDEYWQLIMDETDPNKIKKLGRGVRNFNEKTWNKHRSDIVYKGNMAKFTQNETLKKKLLSYDKTLYFVEASKVDKIWGIGLNVTDPRCKRKANWNGLNLLGKAITKVRNDILEHNL